MTTELEKHFFNIFEIEPIGCNDNENCTGTLDCSQCTNAKYPQITDRILLELICIVYKAKNSLNSEIDIFELNVEKLKSTTLERLIWINNTYKNKRIKHQVQALFEENNNDR